ncbi:leucine--tRNA ligase [archaeon]|jgi:leucyl-tRNA synthetase|nr:leucine--tRNA ligase [archaeon]MBT4647122.1 leucine--tRNA ligase [archaeon]MBT6821112.1 leucine--tRNA ligase [archaeon]MBT7393064.1 leucine--tRNA ligase [archaeon]
MEEIRKKWLKKWEEAKVFEAIPDSNKKKFFGTLPYPYVNSYLHLGHFYSSMRLEAFSRYKRMKGFNVLYAQGWHCTGSPIVNAAKRIAENEPIQVGILKKQGFSDDEIKKFADPKAWVEYFPPQAQADFTDMGYSIDWRRQFITTDLNPHYDKFIKWQFNKLKEKNYVVKGKFPVVWDPIENTPVGDHARLEGEGETPQEFILVKHKLDDKFLISATLRQDTILGITNLYVHPEIVYSIIETKGEKWILSEHTANNLKFQDYDVKKIGTIKGDELIGKKVEVVDGRKVLILPATFLNETFGTGLVHSVPSDSADDLIALYDLQKDEETCKKYGIDIEELKGVKPIGVLNTEGYGDIPAKKMLEKYNVKHQNERGKLDKIKKELYKLSYYNASFNHLYKDFFDKNIEGVKVEDGKEYIKEELMKMGWIDIYYQLTGKVVARSLGECLVKIVDNQWFLAYGDEDWTNKARECLDGMKLFPDKTRSQFNYVLGWLHNWACTRELGLGTKLPWDESWLIESLSDSTIYMAFYTINYKLKNIDSKKLDDAFFNYILLSEGDGNNLQLDKEIADELKEEFEYWYPMDFRTTGKDLIQNHMSFCIFNHVAIFPKKHWPKSFGLNGHVMVNGEKMSKSKGNFIIMRDALKNYGADASRFTALSGGEGIDDANFDTEMAKSIDIKLNQWIEFATQNYNKGRDEKKSIDEWMESQINLIGTDMTNFMEETLFRSALQKGYFDMQRALKWYMRRTNNNPNKDVMNKFIETQTIILAPFTPFICEEIWEKLGKDGFISITDWPEFEKPKESDLKSQVLEDTLKNTLEDISSVLKLAKIKKPSKIKIFISANWKYDFYSKLNEELKNSRNVGELIRIFSTDEKYRENIKEISTIIQKTVKSGKSIDKILSQDDELNNMQESIDFLVNIFNAEVEIMVAEKSDENKAKQARPGKVAILVE